MKWNEIVNANWIRASSNAVSASATIRGARATARRRSPPSAAGGGTGRASVSGSNISSAAFGSSTSLSASHSRPRSDPAARRDAASARRRAAARSSRSASRSRRAARATACRRAPRCSASSSSRMAAIVARLFASPAVVDRHVAFGVEPHRAVVHVGRADAQHSVVDDHDLGVDVDRLAARGVRDGRCGTGRAVALAAAPRTAGRARCPSRSARASPRAAVGLTMTISGPSGSSSRAAIASAIRREAKYWLSA